MIGNTSRGSDAFVLELTALLYYVVILIAFQSDIKSLADGLQCQSKRMESHTNTRKTISFAFF